MHMISKGLISCGHDVTVSMGRRFRPGLKYKKIDGIQVYWSSGYRYNQQSSRVNRVFKFLVFRYNQIIKIFWILKKEKFDWIIGYALGIELFIPVLIFSKIWKISLGAKWGDIIHRDMNQEKIQYLSSMIGQYLSLKYADVVINIGGKNLTDYFLSQVPTARIITLSTIVDPDKFQTAKGDIFRQRYKLKGKRLITYVGGFKHFEGLEDVILAMVPLMLKDQSLRLVLAGGGVKSDLAEVISFIDAQNINNHIVLTGQLELSDVAELLAASEILVLPKVNHPINKYAMPIKLGEYLTSGKPVIAARVGGIINVISHGVNGLLFEPGNTSELRQNVEILLNNTALSKQIGKVGQITAQNQFHYMKVAHRLVRILNNVNG